MIDPVTRPSPDQGLREIFGGPMPRHVSDLLQQMANTDFDSLINPENLLAPYQRNIELSRRELEQNRNSENRTESVLRDPSITHPSYGETSQGNTLTEEYSDLRDSEVIGTISVNPIVSSYSDIEYSNSAELSNRTVTITECTESASIPNESDNTNSTVAEPSLMSDDAVPWYCIYI